MVILFVTLYKPKKDDNFLSTEGNNYNQPVSTNKSAGFWKLVEKSALPSMLLEFLISFSAVSASLLLFNIQMRSENFVLMNLVMIATIILIRLVISSFRIQDKMNIIVLLIPAVICGFLTLVFSTLIDTSTSIAILITVALVNGAWIGISVPILCSVVFKRTTADHRGAASSSFLFANGLAGILGGTVFGSLIYINSIAACIFGIIVLIVATILIYLFNKRKFLE